MKIEDWIEVDKYEAEDQLEVLGCDFHENWYSIIFWDESKKAWFNQFDHECECWPSHIIDLPPKPYE